MEFGIAALIGIVLSAFFYLLIVAGSKADKQIERMIDESQD